MWINCNMVMTKYWPLNIKYKFELFFCLFFFFFSGVVTIIQRGDHGPFGETYTVAPITTYKVYNEKSCFKLSGFNESKVEPQVALPDLSGFKVSLFTYLFLQWFKSLKNQSFLFIYLFIFFLIKSTSCTLLLRSYLNICCL